MPLKEEKVWRILAQEGEFALKALAFPAAETAFIAAALNHLYEAGLRKYSYLLPARGGCLAPSDGAVSYFLSPFFQGREANYGDRRDVAATASLLAAVHRAAAGFRGPDYSGRIKWGNWPQMIEEKGRELTTFGQEVKAKREQDRFDRLFLRYLPLYEEDLQLAAAQFAASDYRALAAAERERGGFCHHDLAHHNFLLTAAGPHLIDFDYAIADIRCHDIANFLLKIMKENNWDERLAVTALAVYDHENPLLPQEGAVIKAILRFPQDFWQVVFARYREHIVHPTRCESKLQRWTRGYALRRRALSRLDELF